MPTSFALNAPSRSSNIAVTIVDLSCLGIRPVHPGALTSRFLHSLRSEMVQASLRERSPVRQAESMTNIAVLGRNPTLRPSYRKRRAGSKPREVAGKRRKPSQRRLALQVDFYSTPIMANPGWCSSLGQRTIRQISRGRLKEKAQD